MSKHTPGPWVLNGRAVEEDKGSVIAYVEEENNSAHEANANARLIASAPDLLAALEAVLDAHRRMAHCEADHVPAALLNAAEDAIAKAVGE